jgi:hypothetical protein
VKFTKILRNGIAGALIALLPATTSMAATRPNAAVPAAGSAAVTAQYDAEHNAGISWVALAAIGLGIVVALWIILSKDKDGEGALSRG